MIGKNGFLPGVIGALAFACALCADAVAETGGDARSASDKDVVDQITVVAHKSERSIRSVAANVTTVDRDELDSQLANSIADALRYTPGIDYEASGMRFGTEGINIRGIGGNRVALLIDNVPLSDQFDVGSFSNATRDFIDAGFVQRMEVLHGPASALYGSSAIGGVVALRTSTPADLVGNDRSGGALVTSWRDADSSLHGTAQQAWQGDTVGVIAGFSVRDGQEFDSAAVQESLDQREYLKRSAMLKLVVDDRFGNSIDLGYYMQDSEVQSDFASMLGSGRFRSTTALEGDDTYRMDILSAGYRFGSQDAWFGDGVLRAYVGETDIEQSTLDERGLATRPVSIDRFFSFEQALSGIELNLQKEFSTENTLHRLAVGAEYRQRETEEFRDGLETGIDDGLQTSVLLGENFPLRDFPISDSTDLGVYLEDTISVGDWTVIAALRADRFDLDPRVDPMYQEDYPFAEPVSLSESELSPKLGLVYAVSDTVDVFAQYAHGFRAPPYEDANVSLDIPVFNYRAIPNPDLRPESSDGIDIGVRWLGQAGNAYVSAFRTDYEDFIESKVRLGPDPVSGRILFQSQNVHRAVIEGVEAGGTLSLDDLVSGLSVDGALYIASGENRDSDEPLNSVGPPQAILGLNWTSFDGRWQTRLRGTFTDRWSERDESRGELFEPPSYEVLDLYVARSIGERMTLRAGLLNLTDETYWVWSDVRGLAPDDPVIPYLAKPGRSVTLGLDMNW